MPSFTSRCSFGVITVLIALAISHVMGFEQRFLSFQRSSSSCCPSDNSQNASGRNGSTSLFMGKFRNKQAELQRKMELAKQQAAQKASENDDGSSLKGAKARMSDEELKEANDRKRFDELLNSQSASIGVKSSDSYLTQDQEEENIDAFRKGVDRFFEGDPAPSEAFEELVSIKSENAIGGPAAKRLLPWLRNANKDDYVVVVSDPREKSPEFQNTLRDLSSELPRDIFSKIVFINADTPAQNRRLLKKNNISESNIRLFSDEKREWMQAYTALGENRWSMTLFVLADERVQKVVREFSSISASDVVKNAVKATNQRRL
mmetsp:Transcript_7537/g.18465  ORF Transcript_7537/g.18465 Transcript_7537/m.18465 type:complete len:319 (+) Transcript_7537:37-993(+)